jgi:hypothetical protein
MVNQLLKRRSMNRVDLNRACESPTAVTLWAGALCARRKLSQNRCPLPLSAFMSYGRGFLRSMALACTQHQKDGRSQGRAQNSAS